MVPINNGYRTTDAGFVLGHTGVRAVVAMGEFVPLLLDVRAAAGTTFEIRSGRIA